MSDTYVSCPKCGNKFRVTVTEESEFSDYSDSDDLFDSDFSDSEDLFSDDSMDCEKKKCMERCIKKAIKKCRKQCEQKCQKCKACQNKEKSFKKPSCSTGKYSSPIARRLLLRRIMAEHRARSPPPPPPPPHHHHHHCCPPPHHHHCCPPPPPPPPHHHHHCCTHHTPRYTPKIRQSPLVTKQLIEDAMERRKQQLLFEKEEKTLRELKKKEKELKKKQSCLKRKLKQQELVVKAVSPKKCAKKKSYKHTDIDGLSDSDSFVEKCVKKYEIRKSCCEPEKKTYFEDLEKPCCHGDKKPCCESTEKTCYDNKDVETLRQIADDLQKYSCTMKGILDSGFSPKKC